jgi:hypothetical protein
MKTKITKQREARSKRLLIVEDRLDYMANACDAARERGYAVDRANDLETARRYLTSRKYTGVVTDMCFHERGISPEGHTSPALRREILQISLKAIPFELYKKMERTLLENIIGSEEDIREEITCGNTRGNPALGYFIARNAKDLGIPVSIVSSLSHAMYALPAIYATGLVSQKELLAHTEKQGDLYKGTIPDRVIKDETWKNFLNERYWERAKKSIRESLLMDRRFMGFVFDKIILPGDIGKCKAFYDLAIDQIEGNIDNTRPYRVS